MKSTHSARSMVAVLAILGSACSSSSSSSSGSGGTRGTGGAASQGGTPASGGQPETGGANSTGGTPGQGGGMGSGGTPQPGTGGVNGTGGPTGPGSGGAGTGGRLGSGGAGVGGAPTGSGGTVPAAGGNGALGGAGSGGSAGSISSSSGGRTTGVGGTVGTPDAAPAGTDGGLPYQGPCDVLTGGCAEAYGVARGMTAGYKGPLFQLGRISDKASLDVGQTSGHVADMTTWSAFCGGTQSNCVIAKIYAQIHTGNNDLVPSVFAAKPVGPDCSAGGFTCAARFTIEAATGLPIVTTVAPYEYTLANDNFATGITGGSTAMSIMFNGKPVANTTYCCGVLGLTHKHDPAGTVGTDFMVALGYGWMNAGGSGWGINCSKSSTYCVGSEEETQNDLADYGSSPVENAIVLTQFDPSANAVTTYLNGTKQFSHSPPTTHINAGTAIHLGGGGDLSQPDPVLMREGLFRNTVTTEGDVKALNANIVAFYSSLKFP